MINLALRVFSVLALTVMGALFQRAARRAMRGRRSDDYYQSDAPGLMAAAWNFYVSAGLIVTLMTATGSWCGTEP